MAFKIQKIRIEGVTSFAEDTVFELDRGASLNLMKGKNGRGKTSLLGALPWIIYGKHYKEEVNNSKIVTWEEIRGSDFKGTRGILYGTDGEFDYMIARHIKYKADTNGLRGSDNLMLFKKSKNEKEFTDSHLTDARYKTDIQNEIDKIIGIEYNSFMQSVFFAQNSTRLIQNTREENLKLFERLLSAEWIKDAKEYAKKEKLDLETKIDKFGIEIENINYLILAKNQNIQSNSNILSNFNTTKKKALKVTKDNLEVIEEDIKTTKANISFYEKSYDSSLEGKVTKCEIALKKIRQDTSIEDAEEILKKAKNKENDKDLKLLHSDYKSLYEKYFGEDGKVVLKDLEIKQFISSGKSKIEKLENKVKDLGQSKKHIDKDIKYKDDEVDRLKKIVGIKKEELNIKKNQKIDDTCPTCKQKYPATDIKIITDNFNIEISLAGREIEDLESKFDNIDRLNIEDKLERDAIELGIKDINTQIKELKKENNDKYKAEIKIYNDLNTACGIEVERTKAKYVLAYSIIEDGISFAKQSLKDTTKEYERILKLAKSSLKYAKEQWDKVSEYSTKKYKEEKVLAELVGERKISLQNVKRREDSKPPELNTEGLKTDIHKFELDIKNIENKRGILNSRLEKVKWWFKVGFGSSGLKAYIFMAGLESLNKHLKTYANKLGYQIIFKMDLESKNKSFVTLVSYTRLEKGKPVKYEKDFYEFSGGEQQRIVIAISFAMHDLVADKFNSNILILDEIFKGLDEEGRDITFEFIRNKTEEGKSVYVVTHNDIIDSKYAKTIYIDKNEKGSYIKR